ncbi:MAG: hypothetical protein WBP41_21975, partial [Saprospiraceae bacterium]
MKQLTLNLIFSLLSLVINSTKNINAQIACLNSGLENGDYTNWSGLIGHYSGANLFGFNNINSGLYLFPISLGSTPRISIITPGLDPKVPIQKVYSGNYAIKIGMENVGNKEAERIVYDLLVDNNNKKFKYNYAVVLEEPNHSRRRNPFFWARILYNGSVICQTGRKSSGTGDPFFKDYAGFQYRNWDCVSCDLSNYVGRIVQVEFTVAGCAQGGHSGYAYIDGLCDIDPINLDFNLNKDTYCLG